MSETTTTTTSQTAEARRTMRMQDFGFMAATSAVVAEATMAASYGVAVSAASVKGTGLYIYNTDDKVKEIVDQAGETYRANGLIEATKQYVKSTTALGTDRANRHIDMLIGAASGQQ